MEGVSAAMSILFPVTGNGGSRSEANLQLKTVLAEHGFHAVNFIICPTVKEALEAPIEEWKREFAEFAEWSWEIKDSAGTVGLWRGQVDRQREASLVIPASTVGAGLALLAANLTVSTALDIDTRPFLNVVQGALAFAALLAIIAAARDVAAALALLEFVVQNALALTAFLIFVVLNPAATAIALAALAAIVIFKMPALLQLLTLLQLPSCSLV